VAISQPAATAPVAPGNLRVLTPSAGGR
jgi:hypothetical protein